LAAGLPVEGTKATVPTVGSLARRGVPTCTLDERVGNVWSRVRATDWDQCVVLNDHNVVLGRLRSTMLEGSPDATAEQVMESGPVTYRPHEVAQEAARKLAERHVRSVLVTTADGELMGAFRAEDASDAAPRKIGAG